MHWLGDALYRGPLSPIEHEAWRRSDAGQLVLHRPILQRIAHLGMWPVYLGEGLFAMTLYVFTAKQRGQGHVRLPDDWMLGHRGIPPTHMTPIQLARAVWGAEGRQCFWLMVLVLIGLGFMLWFIQMVTTSKGGVTGSGLTICLVLLITAPFLTGVGARFWNARQNMIRFKRAAAFNAPATGQHGQARIVALDDGED